MEISHASVFAVFDQQDSGCIAYGIESEGRRMFVKTATTPAAHVSLGRAIRFHRAARHPAIVAPTDVVDTSTQRQLIYPWREGIVLNHATVRGSNRAGLDRFRQLPSTEILVAIDRILDAHITIAAAGFVSVDLYDGCFLYDFERSAVHLIDLDEYRPGPFAVEGERLPGSARYMAPEDLLPGAMIDERTTVFHLGRVASQLLGDRSLTVAQQDVVATATQPQRECRFPTVETMVRAWRSACGSRCSPGNAATAAQTEHRG